MLESFPPVEKPVKKKTPKKEKHLTALDKLNNHKRRFIFAAMAAAGLHVPLTPIGRQIMESIGQSTEMKGLEGTRQVLDVQTPEEKQEKIKQINERVARIDRVQLDAYKNEQKEKLAMGEPVTFREMFFNLERLNGVDEAEVKEAEKKADATIAKYKSQMGERMNRGFVTRVVDEMYGSNDTYEWGQGSVVKYFNTGKRNCYAIAAAEEIVFEGLLEDMPPEERESIHVGRENQKQHVIATLTFDKQIGDISPITMRLEPGAPPRMENEPGTAFVTLETQKQALVSDFYITIKAGAGKVGQSPDILSVSNQPVNDGIIVEGPLRGSDYVQQVAEERGIKPQIQESEPTTEVMSLEILDEDQNEHRQYVKRQIEEALKKPEEVKSIIVGALDVNTPEQIKNWTDELASVVKTQDKVGVYFVSLGHWPEAELEKLLRSKVDKVSFEYADVSLLERAIDTIIKDPKGDKIPILQIVTNSFKEQAIPGEKWGVIFEQLFILEMLANKGNTIRIELQGPKILGGGFLPQIEKAGNVTIILPDYEIGPENVLDIDVFKKTKATLVFDPQTYKDMIILDEKVLDHPNIKPDLSEIKGVSDSMKLVTLRTTLMNPSHPHAKELIKEIDKLFHDE